MPQNNGAKVKGFTVSVEVWGNYACFTRPEFSAERETYDCMTPSAAVGLLKSIYWHPGMEYVIDRIHVLTPIRHMNIKQNEVKDKLNRRNARLAMENGTSFYSDGKINFTQRNTHLLVDVHYVIEAHPILTEKNNDKDLSLKKITEIFSRRVDKGQSYRTPCFGQSEFEAYFKPVERPIVVDPSLIGKFDLGEMLYEMDYSKETVKPRYFRAKLVNGVLDIPKPDSREVYYAY